MVKGMGRHRFKLGDTLVEVSIAIGIFSMVAIATVAVVNASTSGSQSVLENTITREEIDAQAEALRFIQSAYVATGDTDATVKTTYSTIWNEISKKAITLSSVSSELREIITNYNPTTCAPLYDSTNSTNLASQHAFIINNRAISSSDYKNILIWADSSNLGSNGIFRSAETYPRIVYNQSGSDTIYDQGEDANTANKIPFSLQFAEGLFVVPVKDESNTIIVSDETGKVTTKSAYIDFYIRSCWFAPGADRASTISTVIRLYDPSAVSINKYQQKGVIIEYDGNGNTGGAMPSQYVLAGSKVNLLENQYIKDEYVFVGWQDASGNKVTSYTAPSKLDSSQTVVTFKAIWAQYSATLNYSGGTCPTTLSGSVSSEVKVSGATFTIKNNGFTCTRYQFTGWRATIDDNTVNFSPGDLYVSWQSYNDYTINLVAQWSPIYMIVYNTKSSWSIPSHTCDNTYGCTLSSDSPTRSGYEFKGWCTVDTSNDSCSGTVYNPGSTFPASALTSLDTNLYAMWKARNETITITLTWNSYPNDLDAHVQGQRSDNSTFHAFYSQMVGSDVSGLTIASLDRDVTTGYGPETFTINTLGGKNYYYYVHCFSSCTSFDGGTVTVSGPYLGTRTFYASNASGTGTDWNVFAYKDGQIVPRQTKSYSPQLDY